MPPTTVSFTVRRPTPVSRPSSSGPESDGGFKVPALPRHLASAGGSASASPLAGSPRTFSSREDSDDDGETGIIFENDTGENDQSYHTDSSDEDILVATSKHLGGQRKKKRPDSQAPLVIPAKPNPDWREAARRRRAACARTQPRTPSFVPVSGLAATGADGSVGLGTRDTINSGPQLSGLHIKKSEVLETDSLTVGEVEITISADQSTIELVEETEDQRALRAILAGEDESAPVVEIIPAPPLSEEDALRQDMQELPDVATADDYDRVPISVFGAAMLRGMGWTDGAVAPKSNNRRKNALTDLYLPQARPALLGIGAKEQELEDGDGKKQKRPNMRYIPVARQESGRGENGSSRSGTVSRRSSRSPSRQEKGEDRVSDRERGKYDDHERRREWDRDRDRGDESRRRTKDSDYGGHRDRDRDRDMEKGRSGSRSDRYRDRERHEKGKQYDQRDRR